MYSQTARFMGPTWVLSAPDGPNVGPMNLAIRVQIFTEKILKIVAQHSIQSTAKYVIEPLKHG